MTNIKKILSNAFFLFLMKRHYFLNFVIIRFLIKTLGIEKFGELEFCKSIAFYFYIFINFGFNYISSRKIHLERENKKNVSKIYFTTQTCKLVIIFFLLPVQLLIANIFLTEKKHIFLLFSLISIASSLSPIFIYQGLNKMPYLLATDFFSKLFLAIIIFKAIKTKADGWIYPLAYAFTDTARALITNFWIYKKEKLTLYFPKLKEIKILVTEGFHSFFFVTSRTIYERLPQIIIGTNLGLKSVGIYTVAVKIIGEINVFISQFIQATFPFSDKIQHKKFFKNSIIFIFFISAFVYSFPGKIISIFTKEKIPEALLLLKIASIVPVPVFIYTFFIINMAPKYKKEKLCSKIILAISTFCMICLSRTTCSLKNFVILITFSETLCACIILWIFRKTLKEKNV